MRNRGHFGQSARLGLGASIVIVLHALAWFFGHDVEGKLGFVISKYGKQVLNKPDA